MNASVTAAPPERKWRRVDETPRCTFCGGGNAQREDGAASALGRPDGQRLAACPSCLEKMAHARRFETHGPLSNGVPSCASCHSVTSTAHRSVQMLSFPGGAFGHCVPIEHCPNAPRLRTSNVGFWLTFGGIAAGIAILVLGGWLRSH